MWVSGCLNQCTDNMLTKMKFGSSITLIHFCTQLIESISEFLAEGGDGGGGGSRQSGDKCYCVSEQDHYSKIVIERLYNFLMNYS